MPIIIYQLVHLREMKIHDLHLAMIYFIQTSKKLIIVMSDSSQNNHNHKITID